MDITTPVNAYIIVAVVLETGQHIDPFHLTNILGPMTPFKKVHWLLMIGSYYATVERLKRKRETIKEGLLGDTKRQVVSSISRFSFSLNK